MRKATDGMASVFRPWCALAILDACPSNLTVQFQSRCERLRGSRQFLPSNTMSNSANAGPCKSFFRLITGFQHTSPPSHDAGPFGSFFQPVAP
jgi:hypothetical protein